MLAEDKLRINTNKLEKQKIDKSQWARGEWTDEPDFISWHAPGLYRCKAVRHSYLGHWCGYVGLPAGYVFERDIDELEVHGGITYDRVDCKPNGIELKGRWLGLDCAHIDDYSPNLYSKDFEIKQKLKRSKTHFCIFYYPFSHRVSFYSFKVTFKWF